MKSAHRKVVRALLWTFLAWSGHATGNAAEGPDSLLMITIDTTRADALSCYGGSPGVSPHLDRLAAGGVRFDRAYTTVPYTVPSHASLMTGELPFIHGIRTNSSHRLPQSARTLAEHLSDAGLRTVAFPAASVLVAGLGLNQGFDEYFDRIKIQPNALVSSRPAEDTAEMFQEWFEREPDKPFFAWLHFFEPHLPYNPPVDLRGKFPTPYQAEIHHVDRVIQTILDYLEQRGVLDTTVVSVCSDHGEGLGDHNESTHGIFLYDDTMRIPWILSHPSLSPLVVRQAVSICDIAPTVLTVMGVDPMNCKGRDLSPFLGENASPFDESPVYTETYVPYLTFGWSPMEAIIGQGWKYIEAPRPELYEFSSDPKELTNRVNDQPERAEQMRKALYHLRANRDHRLNSEMVAMDDEALAKLQALGYASSSPQMAGAELPFPGPDVGVDPKDRSQMLPILYSILDASVANNSDPVLIMSRRVLQVEPDNPLALSALGVELHRRGRWKDALKPLERLRDLNRSTTNSLTAMGVCYLNLDDLEQASAALTASLQYSPNDVKALRWIGEVEQRQGNWKEALGHYRHALRYFRGPVKARDQLVAKIQELEPKVPEAERAELPNR